MKKALLFLFSFSTLAYENMTIKGYSSCIACHRSSNGGGLLTEYGKYISDTSSLKKSKKLIIERGSIDYALQFRYARIEANSSVRKFPMQADLLTSVDLEEIGTFFIDVARSPKSQAIASGIESPKQSDLWFFRKAIFQYKNFFIGRERFNLGLNLVDHTLLNKSLNRMNVSDLITTMGMKSVTKNESYRFFLIGPSFQENTKNRESGVALDYRKYLNTYLNLGAFSFFTKGKTIDRSSLGINLKTSYSMFALLYEGIYSRRSFKDNSTLDQTTNLVRLSFLPHLSTLLFANYERANRNKTFKLDENRIGYGARIKLWKWLSLQYDHKNIKRNNVEENISVAQVFINFWR